MTNYEILLNEERELENDIEALEKKVKDNHYLPKEIKYFEWQLSMTRSLLSKVSRRIDELGYRKYR